MPDSLARFAALGAALAERGLGVQLPVTADVFDEVSLSAGTPPLRALWSEARAALLVGSGGSAFFERFERASPSSSDNPLDAFTRDEVERCCESVLGRGGFSLRFPFVGEEPALPFQRLARGAGAPRPGPLGLIVLRAWGPWWAFRALVLLPFEVPALSPANDLCAECAAPCVKVCPPGAVTRTSFLFSACAEHRSATTECADRCLARRACPVSPEQAYSPAQAAFHMRALSRSMSPSRA